MKYLKKFNESGPPGKNTHLDRNFEETDRIMASNKKWASEHKDEIQRFISDISELSWMIEDESINIKITDIAASAFLNSIGARIFIHRYDSNTKENDAWIESLLRNDSFLEWIDRLQEICDKWKCGIFTFNPLKNDGPDVLTNLIIIKHDDMKILKSLDTREYWTAQDVIKKYTGLKSKLLGLFTKRKV